MAKSTDDDYLEIMQFDSITEFVEILHLRQKTLNNHIKNTKTLGLRQRYGDRIDEVNHFIELIKHSNLTCRDKKGNDTRLVKPARKTSAIPAKKRDIFLPGKSKKAGDKEVSKSLSANARLPLKREPAPGSKKSLILAYIRKHQKVTAKQVAVALGFQDNSVSAHINALQLQQLVVKGEGKLWRAVVS